MCVSRNNNNNKASMSSISLPGTTQFPQPDSFYCCHCGHGPWLCAIYAACIECGHHFGSSCCTPAYTGGGHYSSSTNTGPRLIPSSSSKASVSNSSIYNYANGMSPSSSTEDLTAPNARVPPPVGHSACGHAVLHQHPNELVDGFNPMAAPAADGEQTWFCCNCQQGPYLASLYGRCMYCPHERCYYCKIE